MIQVNIEDLKHQLEQGNKLINQPAKEKSLKNRQ